MPLDDDGLTPPTDPITTPKPLQPRIGTLSDEELLEKGKKHLGLSCDLRESMQYSQYNRLKVGDCKDISSSYKEGVMRKVQLIQRRRFMDLKVLHCSLSVSMVVSYCSHDFFSGARHWEGNTLVNDQELRLSKAECTNAIKTRVLRYQDREYYGLQRFITIDIPDTGKVSGWRVLRGKITPTKGTCEASSFAIHNDYYPSHTLSMRYSATIQYLDGEVNLLQNAMRVSNLIVISDIAAGSFYHPEAGNFHWDSTDSNTTTKHWQEISNGTAEIFKPNKPLADPKQSIAIIHTETSKLAMTLDTSTKICLFHTCRKAYPTNIEGIYLVPIKSGQNHWDIDKLQGSEASRLTDFQAASNSIFLTQELELGKSFDKISQLLCQRNKEAIEASIGNYIRNKGGPSHLVYKGSVIYSFPCKDTTVWLTPSPTNESTCYESPAIKYQNRNGTISTGFINPVTWLIEHKSPKTSCNDDILEYKIGLRALDYSIEWMCRRKGGWSAECKPPQTIAPLHPGKLYSPNSEIIHTNLYSDEQLRQLDEHQWDKVNRGTLDSAMEEFLSHGQHTQINTKMEGILNHIFSRYTPQHGQGFFTKEFEKILLQLFFIWYLVNVFFAAPRRFREARKTYGRGNCGPKLLISLFLCVLKLIIPVVTQESNNCPCRSLGYKEEVYEFVQNREKDKFLKNLYIKT